MPHDTTSFHYESFNNYIVSIKLGNHDTLKSHIKLKAGLTLWVWKLSPLRIVLNPILLEVDLNMNPPFYLLLLSSKGHAWQPYCYGHGEMLTLIGSHVVDSFQHSFTRLTWGLSCYLWGLNMLNMKEIDVVQGAPNILTVNLHDCQTFEKGQSSFKNIT